MISYQTKLKSWKNKPFVKQLIRKFPKAEIFLVGGAVRDIILGQETKDFDLVVRNVSKNDLEKFLSQQGKVNLVGKKFGVFKFRPKNWPEKKWPEIDIALPRTEHSINLSGVYKDFKITSNAKLKIETDLSRRDFTINAMAWDIINQKLIDPFQGLVDLKNKKIKAVGKVEMRFKEDYSRMLRAIRFACQLSAKGGPASGWKIDPKTWTAIKKEIKKITKKIKGKQVIAAEIVAKELVKAIGQNPTLALELLDKSGAIEVLMPELLKMKKCPQPTNWHSEGDVWQHSMLALKNLSSQKFKTEFKNQQPTTEVKFGVLFHDLGKPYTITKTDKIRFYGHDKMSAQKFREIAERLKLTAAGLDVEATEKTIAKHMLLANAKLSEIKDTTIEKYFFSDLFPGQEFLMVMFTDLSATLPPSGKPNFTNYKLLKSKISKLKKRGASKKKLPAPLVNGNDIMKQFKLKSGPKIGKLLSIAREAQLNGKIKTKAEGINYLKKYK